MKFWIDNAHVFATNANFPNSIDVIVKDILGLGICVSDTNYLIYVILILS
jgi:hypothetical protein